MTGIMEIGIIRKKNRITSEHIKLAIILIPFFFPGGLSVIHGFEKINYVFHAFKILAIVLFILIEKKPSHIRGKRGIVFLSLLYGLGISFSNIIHDFDLFAFRNMVFFPAFILICIHYLYKKKCIFIESLCYITFFYNICEAFTVIKFYPHGINNYTGYYWEQTLAGAQYFFGSKNQAVFYMLLFLLTLALKEYEKKQEIIKRIYIYAVLFLIEATVLDSANTIVCILLFIVMYSLCVSGAFKRIPLLFKPQMYIWISIIVFFAICILSLGDSMLAIGVFVGLLGRDATFTNRTLIWKVATKHFISHPFIGAGEIGISVLNSVQTQAHNVYLDILFKYGIITFIPYFIMILKSGKKLDKYKKQFEGALLISFMFIMLIHNCFDTMDNYIFILFVALCVSMGNDVTLHHKSIGYE